jgi:glycosyltransferase involved in cell wall biosynthesis
MMWSRAFDYLRLAPYRVLPVSLLRAYSFRCAQVPSSGNRHRLLIDVSVIARHDAGTGIQRVVRGLVEPLLAAPPERFQIELVSATRNTPYNRTALRSSGGAVQQGNLPLPGPGDVFFALDLAANVLPYRMGELFRWKREGVRFIFLAYDLLPVSHPEWFRSTTTDHFRRWLRALATLADDVLCISDAVRYDLLTWCTRELGLKHLPRLDVIPMGCDISYRRPHADEVKTRADVVLMVGTLEPRKGHALVLDTFEKLWETGNTSTLVLAGRPGWAVETLTQRIRNHPEYGGRLIWLESPDDELLDHWYRASAGLIMASEGEGFGLPILEAAAYGKHLLLRDLPVFREIAGAQATYFSGSEAFESALSEWLARIAQGQESPPALQLKSWAESAAFFSAYATRRASS